MVSGLSIPRYTKVDTRRGFDNTILETLSLNP